MANHGGRGRISILPLDTVYARFHHETLSESLPKGWKAEGLIAGGLLARNDRTGTLAIWQGYSMVSIDSRKAEAALKSVAE